jgi:hypothetical protein
MTSLRVTSCWRVKKQVGLHVNHHRIPIEWEQVWFELENGRRFYICEPDDFDDRHSLGFAIQGDLARGDPVWIKINKCMCHITSIEWKGQRWQCWKFLCETLVGYLGLLTCLLLVGMAVLFYYALKWECDWYNSEGPLCGFLQ